MATFLRLAWRNLMRNARRTALTMIALTFGLVVLVVSMSVSNGYHENIIVSAIDRQTGHVELHRKGFLERGSLTLYYEQTDWFDKIIRSAPGVVSFTHRVRADAMIQPEASMLAREVSVLAIDPITEPTVTNLREHLKDPSRYPADEADTDAQIVIGEALAAKLKLVEGKNVLLRSASLGRGGSGSLLFRIRGLYKTGDASMDENVVFITIKSGRQLFGFEEIHRRQGPAVTETVLKVRDRNKVDEVASHLNTHLAPALTAQGFAGVDIEVKTWKEILDPLVNFTKLEDAFMFIAIAIIFLVVAFIILNSLFMSVFERIREFGIILALGVKPIELVTMVVFETALLGLLSLIVGGLVAGGLYYYLMTVGVDLGAAAEAQSQFGGGASIIKAHMTWTEAILCGLGIVVLSIVAGLYPAIRASRIPIVEALRFT